MGSRIVLHVRHYFINSFEWLYISTSYRLLVIHKYLITIKMKNTKLLQRSQKLRQQSFNLAKSQQVKMVLPSTQYLQTQLRMQRKRQMPRAKRQCDVIVSASPVFWTRNSCGRIARASRQIEKVQRISITENSWFRIRDKRTQGATKNSILKISTKMKFFRHFDLVYAIHRPAFTSSHLSILPPLHSIHPSIHPTIHPSNHPSIHQQSPLA